MQTTLSTAAGYWIRSVLGCHQQSERPTTYPWSLLGEDITVRFLSVVLLSSSLDTFLSLLSAFPELRRYVSIVSDGQAFFAPGVKAFNNIWEMGYDTRDYDMKPLVLFIFRNMGRYPALDGFQMVQRLSYYFTPRSFIAIEVPNMQCFQIDLLDHFAQTRGATLLTPVVRYDKQMYKNYQCLVEMTEAQTPDTALLFRERSLVLLPDGNTYKFQAVDQRGIFSGASIHGGHLDTVDISDLHRLQLKGSAVREVTARFLSRRCAQSQCYPNKVVLPRCFLFGQPRTSVIFRGGDVPFVSGFPPFATLPDDSIDKLLRGHYSDSDHDSQSQSLNSMTLANLDWSIEKFHGHSCTRFEKHRESEEPDWRDEVEGPMNCTLFCTDLFYIGVPIETVLRTEFIFTKQFVWKRLTRVDPCEATSIVHTIPTSSIQTRLGASQALQDFLDPRFQKLIHPRHTVVSDTVEIIARFINTLKIWSHLNSKEPFPVFKAPMLKTLVLVALRNSVDTWNINRLVKGLPGITGPNIEKVTVAVLGNTPVSEKLILHWDQYSILMHSVLDLTVIGYTLDKFCGYSNTNSPFRKLQSLSIDVTNLPLIKTPQGKQRLHIAVSPIDFPEIEHLDLSSAYQGSLGFPTVSGSTVTECHTEVWVPHTCVSVTASTALASYSIIINGKMMDIGQDKAVRVGRWRVKWVRCGEEFVYAETFRLPLDPDVVEM